MQFEYIQVLDIVCQQLGDMYQLEGVRALTTVHPSAAGFRNMYICIWNMYICIWGIYDSWRLRNVHF